MEKLVIGREEFRDKVFACWLGKNIGGTLGAPWECHKYVNSLDFYQPVPDGSAPNDDLDIQLIWLKMLEDKGVDPSVTDFAAYWDRHGSSYPWNEYGFCMRNYDRGLRPPISGSFENYFVDEMGSPIRSEIWAVLHAGDPQAAARMAWKDSAVDHAGGEGTWGEMFWSAVEAAAFVERDPLTLIRLGLNMIPVSSYVARAIKEAVWCWENGVTWGVARERMATQFGHFQPCNAIPNHGFTIIGWLYGKDFGDRLCKAVNCGYDTDCTGATLGSVLGIIDGMAGIPEKWIKPIGLKIALHKYTRVAAPADIKELTDRTVALAEKAMAAKSEVAFGAATTKPADLLSRLFRNDLARQAAAQDNHMGIELVDGREIALHYGGEPVLRPGIAREVAVSVAAAGQSRQEVQAELAAPAGWTCERLGPGKFRLFSATPVADRNIITVKTGGLTAAFTMLGPGEAKGFGAGHQVPKCPTCQGRIERCVCPK